MILGLTFSLAFPFGLHLIPRNNLLFGVDIPQATVSSENNTRQYSKWMQKEHTETVIKAYNGMNLSAMKLKYIHMILNLK